MLLLIYLPNMEKLFKLLSEKGGAIVSTANCSDIEIAHARSRGLMWVDEFGCGFVLRSQEWLDYAQALITGMIQY